MDKTLLVEMTDGNKVLSIGEFKDSAYTRKALDIATRAMDVIKVIVEEEDGFCDNFYNSIRILEYVGATLPTEDLEWAGEQLGDTYTFKERFNRTQPALYIKETRFNKIRSKADSTIKIDIKNRTISFKTLKSFDKDEWIDFLELDESSIPVYENFPDLDNMSFETFNEVKDMIISCLVSSKNAFISGDKIYRFIC